LNHFCRYKAFRLVFLKQNYHTLKAGQVLGVKNLSLKEDGTFEDDLQLCTDHNHVWFYVPSKYLKPLNQYLSFDLEGQKSTIIAYLNGKDMELNSFVSGYQCPIKLGTTPVTFPTIGDAQLWLILQNQNLSNYQVLQMT